MPQLSKQVFLMSQVMLSAGSLTQWGEQCLPKMAMYSQLKLEQVVSNLPLLPDTGTAGSCESSCLHFDRACVHLDLNIDLWPWCHTLGNRKVQHLDSSNDKLSAGWLSFGSHRNRENTSLSHCTSSLGQSPGQESPDRQRQLNSLARLMEAREITPTGMGF